MAKFTWGDSVIVKPESKREFRAGQSAAVVGVFDGKERGEAFKHFPPGAIYTVEYLDGKSAEIHEDDLEFLQ